MATSVFNLCVLLFLLQCIVLHTDASGAGGGVCETCPTCEETKDRDYDDADYEHDAFSQYGEHGNQIFYENLHTIVENIQNRLAVEFFLNDHLEVVETKHPEHNDYWFCVGLNMRPEQGDESYTEPIFPNEEFENLFLKEMGEDFHFKAVNYLCHEEGGIYIRFKSLVRFVNDNLDKQGDHDDWQKLFEHIENHHREMTYSSHTAWEVEEQEENIFNFDHFFEENYNNIEKWNHHFETEADFKLNLISIPPYMIDAIHQNIQNDRETFLNGGFGPAGTTGAYFLAGNIGYGQHEVNMDILDKLLFDPETGMSMRSDLEDYVLEELQTREDVQQGFKGQKLKTEAQHRVWRAGPDFPIEIKGMWHRDTSPWGIGGHVPPNCLMFSNVFMIYSENLITDKLGTRAQGPYKEGNDELALGFIPGEILIIRSGEDHFHIPLHAGPRKMQKINPDKPGYRMIMQSKILVCPDQEDHHELSVKEKEKILDDSVHVLPHEDGKKFPESWTYLHVHPISDFDDKESQKAEMIHWLLNLSTRISLGVAECNALGHEPYPTNTLHSWMVTLDFVDYIGWDDKKLPTEEELQDANEIKISET